MTVGLFRISEALVVKWCKCRVLLRRRSVFADGTPVLHEALEDDMVVVASHIEISSCGADIRLILVVTTAEARWSDEKAATVGNVLTEAAWTPDGGAGVERDWIAVEDGAIDGKKTTEVKAHAINLISGLDDGLHVCDTVARKVSMVGQGIESRAGSYTSLD